MTPPSLSSTYHMYDVTISGMSHATITMAPTAARTA